MKFQVLTSVILIKRDKSKFTQTGFLDQKSAIFFLEKQLRLDCYIEGSILVTIKKG